MSLVATILRTVLSVRQLILARLIRIQSTDSAGRDSFGVARREPPREVVGCRVRVFGTFDHAADGQATDVEVSTDVRSKAIDSVNIWLVSFACLGGYVGGFVMFGALLRDALPGSVIHGDCEPVAARLSALATG